MTNLAIKRNILAAPMSQSKKEYIIQQAKDYFNTHGYGSVNMLGLAQVLEMSRGNLAYHFKDKETLLQAIAEEMWSKMIAERNKSRQWPSFENLHNEVQLYYRFQNEYRFIFLDSHVLNNPIIKNQFREMTAQSIADNKAAIAFSIQLGNMRPEPFPGAYNNIAMVTWMITFFWLPQQIIRGKKASDDGEKLIWSLLLPHFTDKGIHSFQKFFGKDFLSQLGDPFGIDLDSLVNF